MTDRDLVEIEEGTLLRRSTILSDKYLVEIGRVVANFAILERELFLLIHNLLSTSEEISRIATTELSFHSLLDLSASLIVHVHGPKDAERYKTVLRTLEGAERERNQIVHSLWYGGWDPGVTRIKHTAKRKKGLQVQIKEYQQRDLQASALKIAGAIFELEKFREILGYK